MVEGNFNINNSQLLTEAQKHLVFSKLANKINSEGSLQVRSQAARSQLENKQLVIAKMNESIAQALKKEKKRIATQPGKGAKEIRLEKKKKKSEQKQNRQKIRFDNL